MTNEPRNPFAALVDAATSVPRNDPPMVRYATAIDVIGETVTIPEVARQAGASYDGARRYVCRAVERGILAPTDQVTPGVTKPQRVYRRTERFQVIAERLGIRVYRR